MFRKTRLINWSGDLPKPGEYLKTSKGSLYLILKTSLNTRKDAKSLATLDLLKYSRDDKEHLSPDAIIHSFRWVKG